MVIKMQRYFIEKDSINDNQTIIEGKDYHHIKNVMRFKIKDLLILNTNDHKSYEASITNFTKDKVFLEIKREIPIKNNTINLSLAQALIKRDNFELVLQKTTELGIKEIYPIITNRSVVKVKDISKKLPRFNTIVKEASEQSERSSLPKIHDLSKIEDLPYNQFDVILIAYARELNNKLSQVIKEIDKNSSVLILIGPAGGFSEKELKFLKTKGKFISLGKTILRSETAAIYVASAFRLVWE